MSKTIKLTDEAYSKLAELAEYDGNTIAGEISTLIVTRNTTNQICEKIDKIAEFIKNIKIAKNTQSARNTRNVDVASLMQEADSYARSMWEKASQEPQETQETQMPGRTYGEVIEEVNQLQEELKSLDDDSPRAKEIKNKIRADNAELALLDED